MILARLSLIFALIAYGSSNSMSGTFQVCNLSCNNGDDEIPLQSDNTSRSRTLIRGKAGPRGDRGKVGHPGAKGAQGEKGADGRQGTKGSQGEKGDVGRQGIKGEDGRSFNESVIDLLQRKITDSDATVAQLQSKINQLEQESDTTVAQLESRINQLERESDEIKQLRPRNCSQIKELNPEATTGKYSIYDNIFSVGEEVFCDGMTGEQLGPQNCSQIKELNPGATTGKFLIYNNSSSVGKEILCDMTSEGVQIFYNCKQILDNVPSSSNGVYAVNIDLSTTINVYCDMNGGGWTVIQKRSDDSVNYRKNMEEYGRGFGQIDGEHWLGLNAMNKLTEQGNYTLRFELEAFDGETAWAEYSNFHVSPGTDYTLTYDLNSYRGTAGDSLHNHHNRKFSTYDMDQDGWSKSCSTDYVYYNGDTYGGGGWWFNSCGFTLTAMPYGSLFSINWNSFRSSTALKAVVMKIKRV